MIKISILGAETKDGGELIRLLTLHPEIEIKAAIAPEYAGVKLNEHHHGLIGETELNFVKNSDFTDVDILFVCDRKLTREEVDKLHEINPDLKIILFKGIKGDSEEEPMCVYGLPEINRKALVRGAETACVPNSFASMSLVALYPFALHLLLNSDLAITVKAPRDVVDETDTVEAIGEIRRVLEHVQKSFAGRISIETEIGESRRSALMQIEFDCMLSLQQMIELYSIYDDHNFTFVTTSPITVKDVSGTDKCIISVGKPEDGKALLTVAADCRMRGGAGEAVHIMNLMSGLHEKTGLSLKAGNY